MGKKRNIMTRGRKFLTKHATWYAATQAAREAAGAAHPNDPDQAVYITKLKITDVGNEKFGVVATVVGDYDSDDMIQYKVDGGSWVDNPAGAGAALSITANHANGVASSTAAGQDINGYKAKRTLRTRVLRRDSEEIPGAGFVAPLQLTASIVRFPGLQVTASSPHTDNGDGLEKEAQLHVYLTGSTAFAAKWGAPANPTGVPPLEDPAAPWSLATHAYRVHVTYATSSGGAGAKAHDAGDWVPLSIDSSSSGVSGDYANKHITAFASLQSGAYGSWIQVMGHEDSTGVLKNILATPTTGSFVVHVTPHAAGAGVHDWGIALSGSTVSYAFTTGQG